METTTNEIKSRLESFSPKQRELYDLMSKQSKDINELVYDICMTYGKDGEVDLADDEEGNYNLLVTYDGGNHPEYASNLCSTVYSVKAEKFKSRLDNNKEIKAFTLYIEDDSEYEYDRVFFDDKAAVLDALIAKFNL